MIALQNITVEQALSDNYAINPQYWIDTPTYVCDRTSRSGCPRGIS